MSDLALAILSIAVGLIVAGAWFNLVSRGQPPDASTDPAWAAADSALRRLAPVSWRIGAVLLMIGLLMLGVNKLAER